MDIFEDKDICETVIIDDDREFREFLNSNPHGLALVPRSYQGCDGVVLSADAAEFSKWLRLSSPELNVEVRKPDKLIDLHSIDYWFPVVFLASDVTLPVYLNLVASYIYDRMRGALKGDKARVRMEAMYEDEREGVTKKFTFEGDVDALKHAIKRFDVNKFMEK